MDGEIDTRLNGDLPLQSPTEAQTALPENATLLVSGFGSVGYPKALPIAMMESGRNYSLTLVSGGSVGKEIDTDLIQAGMISRRFPYQARAESRSAINDGSISFHDRNISQVGDEVRYGNLVDGGTGVFEAVAAGEDWFIPTMSIGQTPAYAKAADRIILEINESQPLELQRLHDIYLRDDPPDRSPIPLRKADERIGGPKIHFDPEKLEAVVTATEPDTPYSFREVTTVDEKIGDNLAGFLQNEIDETQVFSDSVHIQFGVGSLGNALMGRLETVDFGGRSLFYFGEVIQDGLLNLIQSEDIEAASATSLALSKEGQGQLISNIDQFAKDIILRPSDISNSPSLIDRFGVLTVNSALEVDLYGNANSTHINGTDIVNGIGGSADYTRNGLVSIIVLPSATKEGVSRIVPNTAHVDHTEHDIDVVITEQGTADLRGYSPRERAEEIVNHCVHTDFQGEFDKYLESTRQTSGHIPRECSSLLSLDEREK